MLRTLMNMGHIHITQIQWSLTWLVTGVTQCVHWTIYCLAHFACKIWHKQARFMYSTNGKTNILCKNDKATSKYMYIILNAQQKYFFLAGAHIMHLKLWLKIALWCEIIMVDNCLLSHRQLLILLMWYF